MLANQSTNSLAPSLGGKSGFNPVTKTVSGFDPTTSNFFDDPNVRFVNDNTFFTQDNSLMAMFLRARDTLHRNPAPPRSFTTVNVPEDFRSAFSTPRQLFDFQQALNPADKPFINAGIASASRAERLDREAREAGIATLTGASNRVDESLEAFRNDPTRATVRDELTRRTTGEFEIFTDAEEAAQRLQLGQAFARASAIAEMDAASRGVSSSGPSMGRIASQRAVTDAAGVNLQAMIEAANRSARSQATTDLGNFTTGETQLETGFLNALSQIDAQIASIESGVDNQPTDFLPFAELAFGRSEFDRSRFESDREFDRLLEEQQFDVGDFLDVAIGSIGTGLPKFLLNATGLGG